MINIKPLINKLFCYWMLITALSIALQMLLPQYNMGILAAILLLYVWLIDIKQIVVY